MVERSSGGGEAASSILAGSTMFFAHGVKHKKKELDVLRLSGYRDTQGHCGGGGRHPHSGSFALCVLWCV